MGTNLFADNIVIQHLKHLPRNQWGEEEILHLYSELECLKQELSICEVVPTPLTERVQLRLMYAWLDNHRVAYEEQQEAMHKKQLIYSC